MISKSGEALILILLILALNIQPANGYKGGRIIIWEHGEVTPYNAPIRREGNVYILTDDINTSGDGILVKKDDIVIDGNGHTIQGLITIFNITSPYDTSGYPVSGIILKGRRNVEIRNITIKYFTPGILIESSSNCRVIGSRMEGNVHGILLFNSSGNVFKENIMKNNGFAITLCSNSTNNTIVDNELINNGLDVDYSYANEVSNNTVNGKPLVYLEGVSGREIEEAGQVILMKCNNITVRNLHILNASVGIILWKTNNSVIINNRIEECVDGIRLNYTTNNIIKGNVIVRRSISVSFPPLGGPYMGLSGTGIYLVNTKNSFVSNNEIVKNFWGIQLEDSPDNVVNGNILRDNLDCICILSSGNTTVSGNNLTKCDTGISNVVSSDVIIKGNIVDSCNTGISFSGNNSIIHGNTIKNSSEIGISITSSSNNWFFHNNFIDNKKQVVIGEESADGQTDNSTNIWDDGTRGNYWSDYKERYPNAREVDSVWDTPYVINENNKDRYPLVNPFSGESVPPPVRPTIEITSSFQSTPSKTQEEGYWAAYILIPIVAAIAVVLKRKHDTKQVSRPMGKNKDRRDSPPMSS